MRSDKAPEKRMIGVDLDPTPDLRRKLARLVDGFQHSGNRRPGEAQKENPSGAAQTFTHHLAGFQYGYGGLAGARSTLDQCVTLYTQDLILLVGQFKHCPIRSIEHALHRAGEWRRSVRRSRLEMQ